MAGHLAGDVGTWSRSGDHRLELSSVGCAGIINWGPLIGLVRGRVSFGAAGGP